ncbi:MAG: hypothetical protein AAF961_09045, partial [Planctomycetota bacterium]
MPPPSLPFAATACLLLLATPLLAVSPNRLTPVVRAVEGAAPSVVNIQGQKSITEPAATTRGATASRQVNGMGTGVV